jgi:hypothetical protein
MASSGRLGLSRAPEEGTVMLMDPEALELLRRNSGLRLTAEGVFTFRGDVVPNPRVQTLFHGCLGIREDGDVTLTVGEQWAYVACESVARFVDHLDVTGPELIATIRGQGTERCTEPTLGYGPDERFYLWVDGSAYPAVLARGAHQQLAGILASREEGALELPVEGSCLPIEDLERAPRPHDRRTAP